MTELEKYFSRFRNNITGIDASPVIEVFTEIKKIAKANGVETNGSELIGLIPQKALQHEIMSTDEAIEYLGLTAVKPFSKEANIIEYNLFQH